MSYPAPPHWAEGMFLTPHHMQAFAQHLDGRFARSILGSHPFGWGVVRLDLDTSALENYEFKIARLDVILSNGFVLRVPDEAEIPLRDLREAFERGDEKIDVYIGIPESRLKSPNLHEEGSDRTGRYEAFVEERPDENSGRNDRPVTFRRWRARILLEGDDRDGYSTLRIARLALTGEADPLPAVVAQDIPPVKRVGASERLFRQLDELVSSMAAKGQSLAEQVAERRIAFSGDGGGGDAEMLWKLNAVNGGLSELRVLARNPEVSPYDIYVVLNRAIGDLAIFAPERVVPETPPYDHEKLQVCFGEAIGIAKRLLDAMIPTSFIRAPFEPFELGRQCALEEEWVHSGSRFYLAVESSVEADEVIKKVRALKLCSPDQVVEIQRDRLAGIEKSHLKKVPADLPDREHLYFFQIKPEGELWNRARDDRRLAIFGNAVDKPGFDFSLFVVLRKGD